MTLLALALALLACTGDEDSAPPAPTCPTFEGACPVNAGEARHTLVSGCGVVAAFELYTNGEIADRGIVFYSESGEIGMQCFDRTSSYRIETE